MKHLFGEKAPAVPPGPADPGDLDAARLGAFGEWAAAREYRGLGYAILAGNYTTRLGELDLVAEKDGILVFVEVRTRREGALVSPAETVDAHKQRRVVQAAGLFLAENPALAERPVRFDVAEVIYHGGYRCTIHRIESAFDAG